MGDATKSKSKLPPATEIQYCEQLITRVKLVGCGRKSLIKEAISTPIDQALIKDKCEKLYSAANALVLFCQKFAAANPCDQTDKYRSNARKVRSVVKQLIYHSLNINTNEYIQNNQLMRCNLDLAASLLPITTSCVNTLKTLSSIYVRISEKEFTIQNKALTADEQIQIIFNQLTQLHITINEYRKSVKDYCEKKQTTNQLESIQLNFDQLKAESKLLEEAANIQEMLKDTMKVIRTYLQARFHKDQVNQLELLTLASKFRTTTANFIQLLRSEVIETKQDVLERIKYEQANYCISESFPDRLKSHYLFHLSDKKTKVMILRTQTEQLQQQHQTLKKELLRVQQYTSIKQQRLQQLKAKEEQVLESQLTRHKRDEEWNKNERDALERYTKEIDELSKNLKIQEESMIEKEMQLKSEQKLLLHRKNQIVGISSPITSKSLEDEEPTSTSKSKPTKATKPLGIKAKRGSILLKRDSDPSLFPIANVITNPLHSSSPSKLMMKSKSTSSHEIISSGDVSPTSSSLRIAISSSSLSQEGNTAHLLSSAHSVDSIATNLEDLNQIENQLNSLYETQKQFISELSDFNNRKEKLNRLSEQLNFRKKMFEQNFERYCTASAAATAEILNKIKQDRIDTIQELREYKQTEMTILKSTEQLLLQLRSYREYLNNQQSNSSMRNLLAKATSAVGEKSKYVSVYQSYSTSFKLLCENILKTPKENTTGTYDNSLNIWNEPLISIGNMKTVVFSNDKDSNNQTINPNAPVLRTASSSGSMVGEGNDRELSRAQIKAGTLNQLVIRLTDEKQHAITFLKTFITTYQSFTTTDLFFQKLVERYNVPLDTHSDIPEEQWKQNIVLPIQVRVYNVFKKWIETRFPDFDYFLMKKLNGFMDTKLRKDGHNNFVNVLSAIIKRKIIQEMPNHQVVTRSRITSSIPKPLQFTSVEEFFLATPIDVIAKAFCMVDHKLYQSIQPVELLNCSWTKPKLKHRARNILAFIDHFNTVSGWTAHAICSTEKLRARQNIYTKLITIAEKLRELNDFSSLLAIIAGINSIAVHRLKFTQEGVPQKSLDSFNELKSLMNSDNSYKNYREIIHSVSPPIVPYLGTYLADLVFIDDGNPDTVDGLINFRKREMVYKVIEEIQQYQQAPYQFEADPFSLTYLSTLENYTEEKLLALSNQVEPKNCKDKSELVQ